MLLLVCRACRHVMLCALCIVDPVVIARDHHHQVVRKKKESCAIRMVHAILYVIVVFNFLLCGPIASLQSATYNKYCKEAITPREWLQNNAISNVRV